MTENPFIYKAFESVNLLNHLFYFPDIFCPVTVHASIHLYMNPHLFFIFIIYMCLGALYPVESLGGNRNSVLYCLVDIFGVDDSQYKNLLFDAVHPQIDCLVQSRDCKIADAPVSQIMRDCIAAEPVTIGLDDRYECFIRMFTRNHFIIMMNRF